MTTKTYNVKSAVVHGTTEKNQKRYEPGSTIELEDEDAAPLLATNPPAIEAPAAGKKDKDK